MTPRPSLAPRHWAALYAVAAALGLVLLLLTMPRPKAPEAPSACRAQTEGQPRALACLEGREPTILTAELAGTPRIWACQVQRGGPVAQLDETRARCAEMRAEDLRQQITQFDNGLFIPLYTVLSLLLLGWLASMAGANLGDAAAPGPRRGVAGLALLLAVAIAALVGLDRRENADGLAVIDRLQARGVAEVLAKAPPLETDRDFADAAAKARRSSLHKWLASALWAGALAAALRRCLYAPAVRRDWQRRWPGRRGALSMRAATALPVLALAAAALLFAAGAGLGLAGPDIARPAALLGAGMGAAMAGLVAAAALAAMVALNAHTAHTALTVDSANDPPRP